MDTDKFAAACDAATELLTSLVRIDGASACLSDQTYGIDMHAEQVVEFVNVLKRWGKPDGLTRYERKQRDSWREPSRLEWQLAAKTIELSESLAEKERHDSLIASELKALEDQQDRDLAAVVRKFLDCRHRKYPGVNKDIADCMDKMAVLAGWWPNDDDSSR